MNRKEIEQHLATEEMLVPLLDAYNEQFERIDEISDQLRAGVIDTPDVVDATMKELVAIYSNINTVASLAEVERSIREAKEYHLLKIECDKQNKKYVTKDLEAESKEKIASWRRVTTLFSAYLNNCDRIISVLQSSLKSLEKEKLHVKT